MINDLVIKSNSNSIEFYKDGDDYYVISKGVDGTFNYNISIPSSNYTDNRTWKVVVNQQAFKSITTSNLPNQIFIGDVFTVTVSINPYDLPKSEILVTSSDNITVDEIEYGVYQVTAYELGDSTLSFSLPAYDNAIIQKQFIVESIPIEPLTWVKELPTSLEYTEGDTIELDVELIGGEEPYNYVWEDDRDVVYSDITTNVFSTTANIEMNNSTLSVTATDGGDRNLTSSVLIQVNAIEVPEPEPTEPEVTEPEDPIEPEPDPE